MGIILKQGDITLEDVQVIVNAANTKLAGGGGVDGAIHLAAGPAIMEECRKIGGCPTGEAVMTSGGKLKAAYIIHTAGPVWNGGRSKEAEKLKNSYQNSFLLAKKHGLKTIAFPAISTGVYGYPKEQAALIALSAGKVFEADFESIRYVCYSAEDLKIYQKTWGKMQLL